MKLLFLNGPMCLQCICFNDCSPLVQQSLIWAIAAMVIVISVVAIVLCHLDRKDQRQKKEAEDVRNFEKALKDAVNTREEKWARFNEIKASTDEALKKQVKVLKENVENLTAEVEHQKKVNELLDKLIEKYKNALSKLEEKKEEQKKEKKDDAPQNEQCASEAEEEK